MRHPVFVLLVLAACDSGKPNGEDSGGSDLDARTPDGLVFALAADASVAGDAVAYTLEVAWSDGTVEPVDGAVTSDLEAALDGEGGDVVATVAGAHTLTAAAEVDGEALVATETLDVSAGPLAALDLSLTPSTVPAGEPAAWAVAGEDAYGNAVDAAGAQLSVDDALAVAGDTVSGTLVGDWTVTASLGGLSDAETLTIVAGDPAGVELALSSMALAPGESAVATVVVVDTWGNLSDAPWSLSAAGGDATVADDVVTFEDEGLFTVTVEVDGTGLTDSVGPVVVDGSGPALVVESPERGGWATTGGATVTGTVSDSFSGVDGVVVDGAAATVAADGTWEGTTTFDFGLNVVETTATDAAGNVTTDVRAVLAGDVLPWGRAEGDGLVVRLHEGEGGLDAIEGSIGDVADASAILASVPNPVYSGADEVCTTIGWWSICVDYTLEVEVTSLSWDTATLDLDPRSDGTVLATLTLGNVSAGWTATGDAGTSTLTESGTATATGLTVEVALTLDVDGGSVVASVGDVETTLSGLDLGTSSTIDTLLSVLGADLEAEVESALGAAVEDAVGDAVPGAVEDALGDLSVDTDFAVGDGTATLSAVPAAISTDDTGITLALSTVVSLDAWTLGRTADGTLEYGYGQPTWTGTPGALVGLSADMLGQVLFAAWGAGALSLEATDEDLGLDMAIVSMLLPGLTDLTVVTDPLLPPVAVPGSSGDFDLEVGDLLVSLYDGAVVPGAEVYTFYVSTVTPMDVDVADGALTTSLGTPVAWVDVVVAPDGVDTASLEDALEVLAPSLLGAGVGALAEIPLPSLGGYALNGATASVGGAEGGYAVVGGDLQAE